MGRRLIVAYDSDDRKVSQVTLTNSGGGVTPAVYVVDAASALGTSTTGGTDGPTLLSSVRTRLDGPRSDVTDVTYFYTTAWGALRGIRDADGYETWVERNQGGYPTLPTRVQYPNGWVVKATYYANGLLNQVTDSSTSAVTSYVWNTTWSQPTQITSPRGVVTNFQYNATTGNREWQAVGPDTVKFSYNSSKQLIQLKDPEGNTTTFSYDSRGNLSSETALGSSTAPWTRYQRDGRGYPTLTSTATGVSDTLKISTSYDVMGRVTETLQTNTADSMWLRTTTEYYPPTGYRWKTYGWGGTTASDSTTTGVTEWTYDGLGRVIREKRPVGSDSLAYDVAGTMCRLAT